MGESLSKSEDIIRHGDQSHFQSQENNYTCQIFTSISAEEHIEILKNGPKKICPIDEMEQKLLIAGTDRRHRIGPKELECLPYSAVLKIEARFGKNIYSGSAALIGPNYAITAAHNVYNHEKPEWATSIRVISANEDIPPTFSIRAIKFSSCDLALLILKDKVNSKPFEMSSKGEKASLTKEKVMIAGFPVRSSQDKPIMYRHDGSVAEPTQSLLNYMHYNIDTTNGQSGSPVVLMEADRYLLIGIHSKCGKLKNLGVPLTEQIIKQIDIWMKEEDEDEKSEGGVLDNRMSNDSGRRSLVPPGPIFKEKWRDFFTINDNKGLSIVCVLQNNQKPIKVVDDEKLIELAKDLKEQRKDEENKILDTSMNSEEFGRTSIVFAALNLCLESCSNITDNGISELIQSLPNFKNISIDLSGCLNIASPGISNIIDYIESCKSDLRTLTLKFKACIKISDNDLNVLGEKISSCTNLAHLALDFSNCEGINDQGVTYIAKALARLPKLTHLALSFKECTTISDIGSKLIILQIENKPNLRKLQLDFFKNWKIKNSTVECLARALRNKPFLTYLDLDFRRCSHEITVKAQNQVESVVKTISNLNYEIFWS